METQKYSYFVVPNEFWWETKKKELQFSSLIQYFWSGQVYSVLGWLHWFYCWVAPRMGQDSPTPNLYGEIRVKGRGRQWFWLMLKKILCTDVVQGMYRCFMPPLWILLSSKAKMQKTIRPPMIKWNNCVCKEHIYWWKPAAMKLFGDAANHRTQNISFFSNSSKNTMRCLQVLSQALISADTLVLLKGIMKPLRRF